MEIDTTTDNGGLIAQALSLLMHIIEHTQETELLQGLAQIQVLLLVLESRISFQDIRNRGD